MYACNESAFAESCLDKFLNTSGILAKKFAYVTSDLTEIFRLSSLPWREAACAVLPTCETPCLPGATG